MLGKLTVGLDLGINNVGWAVLRKGEGVEVQAMGTYVFESPLKDENKPSDGLKSRLRGQLRRTRRTQRRKRWRKNELYRVLAEAGLLPADRIERTELFCAATDPYELRAAALDRQLEPVEFGRVLCHLNQRRGFLSPRDLMLLGVKRFDLDDTDGGEEDPKEGDEDTGQIASQIKDTREALKAFPTLGAYLHARLRQGQPVRRKTPQIAEGQKVTPAKQKELDARRFARFDRHMVEDEFENLWESQRRFHPVLTAELKQRVKELMFFQRHLAANRETRGRCTFLPKELRMPRASLTAQRYIIAQDVAHLDVLVPGAAEIRKLLPEERQMLVSKLMRGQDLSWEEVKKALGMEPEAVFNIEATKGRKGRGSRGKSGAVESGKKQKLKGSATVARVRTVLGDKWDALEEQAQRELVGEIISIRDWTDENPKRPAAFRRVEVFKRKAYGPQGVRLTEEEAYRLATLSLPEGYLSVSTNAAKQILKHLLRDMVYSDACQANKFDHAAPDGPPVVVDRLPSPTEEQIPHAVVRASVRSAVRVLNAIHKEFGKPDAIHIELPRDLALGAKRREEIERKQRDREKERKQIVADLIAIDIKPNRANVQKVQLWKELGGAALPYEPDIIVPNLKALMSDDYEVDHIVPRGHNFDDSMANKTVCTRDFNTQIKGAKTPYEALGSSPNWPSIKAHVMGLRSMPLHKRQRILAKERPDDFAGRHLAATGWLSKEVKKLAEQMVERKQDVIVTPGRATAEFRKFWELDGLVPLHPLEEDAEKAYREALEKAERGEADEQVVEKARKGLGKMRSNFLHHAVDALTVALADRSSLKALTDYFQLREQGDPRLADKEERRRLKATAMPDPDLRRKAEEALANAVVVHRPSRKAKGQLHKQTAEPGIVDALPAGEPNQTKVVGKHMVRYDAEGRPAQAYPLENNHHCVVWERAQPNANGVYERQAEVVPMIEAVRRKAAGEPVIRKTRPEPGWRFVMSLCKGDMVEVQDGEIGMLSAFSIGSKGEVDVLVWKPYAASQIGGRTAANPYLLRRLRSLPALNDLHARVILDPLGRVVYREGLRE